MALLGSSAAAGSHDAVSLRGYKKREVHHFWAEGLAVRMENGLVYAVEVFGDNHPFHRRAPEAELLPGVHFGTPRAEVERLIGPPSRDFENGWTLYADWPCAAPPIPCLPSAKASVTMQFVPETPPEPEGGKAEGEKKDKEKDKDKAKEKDKAEGGEKKKDKKKEEPPPPPKPGLQSVRLDLVSETNDEGSTFGEAGGQIIRCSGHELHFSRLSEGMLVKQTEPVEKDAYASLMGSKALAPFAARVFRAVDRPSHVLLYMEDLTSAYDEPCVMDIKMGTRTFQENVADETKRRPDMTGKILKEHESDPTLAGEVPESNLSQDELDNGVTKFRYMQFREQATTSCKHGWRIEGIHLQAGGVPTKVKVPKSLRKDAELHALLRKYLQKSAAPRARCASGCRSCRRARGPNGSTPTRSSRHPSCASTTPRTRRGRLPGCG